jgi:PPM family protein phosphatase
LQTITGDKNSMIERRFNTSNISFSDIGKNRKNNQDHILVSEKDNIYIIADGVGGLYRGDIASKKAAHKMAQNIAMEVPLSDYYTHLLRATILTNQFIYNYRSNESPQQKMGTTLTALTFVYPQYYISHIGDSRCYLYRNSKLVQLTEDQTLKERLIKASNDYSAAHLDARKHILTQAIGVKESCTPFIYHNDARSGDIFLLCTDGLHNAFSHDELSDAFYNNKVNVEILSQYLAETSLKQGADNISFIIVKVDEKNNKDK